MVQSDKWTERFRISDKDLTQARALEATGDPLRWCLMNGKIPEIEYLEWAMRRYELPSINSDFFTAPPDHVFWKRVKPLFHWHEGFFPVSEWDGMLLIACLSPPENFRLAHPHKFILASARHLLLLWNHLNPEEEAQKPAKINTELNFPQNPSTTNPFEITNGTEMPEGFSISAASTLSSSSPASRTGEPDFGALFAASESAPLKTEGDTANGSFAQSENSLVTEMPEGFSGVNFGSTSGNSKVSSAPSSHSSFVLELPENMILQTPPQKQPVQNESVRAKEIAQLNQVENQVLAKRPPAPEPIEIETQTATVTELPTASLVNDRAEQISEPAAEPSVAAPPSAPEPNEAADEHQELSEKTRFTLSSISLRPLDATVSQDDLGAVALSHILQSFNGAMILIMEDGILKPWKWSDFLTHPKNSEMTSILLDKPSIFQIAARSKLPYHGYTRPSEVNNAFFNAFQNGRTPPHVTIAPVVVKGIVCAMLLGLMVKGSGTRSMLSQMESLADEFGRNLLARKKSSAA